MKPKRNTDRPTMPYWKLIQNLSSPILIYRIKTSAFVFANQEALTALEISPTKVAPGHSLDQWIRNLFPKDFSTKWEQAIENCQKESQSRFRSQIHLPSGRILDGHLSLQSFDEQEEAWIQVELKTAVLEDNKRIRTMGTQIDVTADKAQEVPYRTVVKHSPSQDTMQKLQLAIDTAQLGIWYLDQETQQLEWNDQLLEIYGLTREQFEEDLQAWQKQLHPDDIDYANQRFEKIQEGETVYGVEFRIIRPDGSIRYINASGCPAYDADGTCKGWIGINTDVTPIKEKEAFHRAIFDNSLLAIVVTNDQGDYLSVNPAACELFGFDEETFLSLNVKDIAILGGPSSEVRYARYVGVGREIGEVSFRRPDGETKTVQYHATRIEKDFNFSILADISAQKEAEKARTRAKELAVKNKELERFASLASHDLQEPLRTISAFAGLLQNRFAEQVGQPEQEYLDFILQASRRMSALIKGLLAYAKLGADHKIELIDCQQVVETVCQNLASGISQSGAQLEIGQLPVVKGFEIGLQMLFQNLISNSLKFRRKEVPTVIKVSCQEEGRYWIFCVEDNGIGIDSDFYQRIFNIFNRLHNQREYEGSGLGLAHCKRIVELLGGHIWLESEPGKGSKFYFSLPKK